MIEEKITLPINDEISIEEINELMDNVDKFYEERGYPKYNIVWLCNLILRRLYKDRDYFINVEGLKGNGKSNFILLLSLLQCRYSGLWKNKKTGKIARVLPRINPPNNNWEHIKFGFQFKDNMSFLDSSDDVSKKFNSLDKYHPFIIDEGSKNLHKYEWNNKLQFLLVRMSDTERWQNKSVYVCFPNFKELNSAFRNDRVMMRCFLYDRNKNAGYSSTIISIRDVNRYIVDPWWNDLNAKKFEEYLRRIPISLRGPKHILNAEKKLKGYSGNFEVPSLEKIAPRIWDIYMRYKIFYAKKDQQSIDLTEDESIKFKKFKLKMRHIIEYIKSIEPDITSKKLQHITQLSAPSFSKLMNDTEKDIGAVNQKMQLIAQINP